MKNIEKIKSNYTKHFAKEFYNKDSISDLTENEMLVCLRLAEFWAYVYATVPEEHSIYTIFDFMGYTFDPKTKEKNVVVHPQIALDAKNNISKYCWGVSWPTIKKKQETMDRRGIMKFLRCHSVMSRRLKQGNNVVIYGRSDKPIGRTMVASIIMKEAIKLRVSNSARKHKYDWIDFNTLVDAAQKDSFDLADYRSCDFLVVDNIINSLRTVKQNTFIVDHVDPFFLGRFQDHLPTILVCKFDIKNKEIDIESQFGVGFKKIIDSNRTYRIALSGEEKI